MMRGREHEGESEGEDGKTDEGESLERVYY